MTWHADPYDVGAARRLERELGVPGPVAQVLVRRGYGDPAAAREFLEAGERHDPAGLPGAGPACELILRHVAAGSRIAVFGDYDVDGVCSTAIALSALRAVGADPAWRLPARDEGYGLSEPAVRELAGAGVRLVVTVDCGITAREPVALAKELGMDVVVSDHHLPPEVLPGCPVVHPAIGDYPFESLCGAGVALGLSAALRGAAGADPAGADHDLDLAGLATVCDMVPLVGENRRIAREGLEALSRTRRPGLRALMEAAALDPGDLDSRTASFRLGPRLNAAGRLGRADAALELLTTTDPERAQEIAAELDSLNHERRDTEQRITREADALCVPQLASAAIVVAGEGWHPGVVGIVASRLVERHHRPCVVIGLEDGRGRGSGRSVTPYDLHAGLTAAAGALRRFGGHRMAAGVELDEAAVPALRKALAEHAGAALAPSDLVPRRRVDAVVSAAALDLGLAEALERLGPFGAGNSEPSLLVAAARVEAVTAMGKEREHARFTLSGGGARARGVAFRTSQRALAAAGAQPCDAAVSLESNRWNGTVEARVILRGLVPAGAGEVRELGRPELWDGVEAELGCDPSLWWPAAAGPARREICDRRLDGPAAVVADLAASGDAVLCLVADCARRRDSLERLCADGIAAAEWEVVMSAPELAEPFAHVVVLDPPPVGSGIEWAAALPGAGTVALAWGAAEAEFAAGCWRHRLHVRPPMAELWRALAPRGGLAAEDLERALCGGGRHPRDGRSAGRLVRVLAELGLARYEQRTLAVAARARADVSASPAARAYAARLAAAETWLSAGAVPATATLAA